MQRHQATTAVIGGTSMIGMTLRAVAVLAILGVCTTSLAQVIPPSEMPGRERERFTDPPPPRAQPGGSIFSPPGAIYAPRNTKRRPPKAHAPQKWSR